MNNAQQKHFVFKNEFKNIQRLSGQNSNLWDGARILLADVPVDNKQVKRILPFFMKQFR